MIDVLALKYSCLNAINFSEIDFFQELIRKAMEKELISLAEGVEICDAMYMEIATEYEKWFQKHKYDCNKNICKEKYIENHMYLISIYLFNIRKKSEALRLVVDTPAREIHENAIKYFEEKVNGIYVKLYRHEIAISRVNNMSKYYDALKKDIRSLCDVDEINGLLVDYACFAKYMPMSLSDLNNKNIVERYEKYVDAFILESKMMSKFGGRIKELFGGMLSDDLTSVTVEFLYRLLRMRNPKLSESASNYDKRILILNQCQEFAFYLLFENEDIIKFSEDEKVYMRKYLFRKLESDLVKNSMKSYI